MTYAEKLAYESFQKFANAPRSLGDDGFLCQIFEDACKQAMQTQRQLDVHEFQETLKEHGVGGLLYDAIVESINAKVEL